MLLNSGKLVIQNDIRNELQSLQGFVCLPVNPHSQNQRPSLNAQHSVDVPSKNLNAPNPIDAAALAVPKRIGSLLAELGPRASSNETILKARKMFSDAEDKYRKELAPEADKVRLASPPHR